MSKKKTLLLFCLMCLIAGCALPETISGYITNAVATPTFDPASNSLSQAATSTAEIIIATEQVVPEITAQPTTPNDDGNWALFQGDYDSAQVAFETALDDTDTEIQAAAIVGLGRVAYLKGNYQSAIEYLNSVIQMYGQSKSVSHAYYFLGECYNSLGDTATAANAYSMYLSLNPGVIDDVVQETLGDALFTAGSLDGALTAYQASILASSSGASDSIQLKIARVYLAQEDFENAIRQLIQLYEATGSDYTKATANLLLGEAYMGLDMPEQAYARYQDSVQNYPLSYDTYLGLVYLVDAYQAVDEQQRGIIDYYAGQYGYAIDALDRYINNTPLHDDTAHYYKGLSLRALGEYDAAIAEWQIQMEDHPAETYYIDALEDIAYTMWAYQDLYSEGAQVLLDFAEYNPNAPQAADILYQAARILERDNQLASAAETWERLIDLYPAYENSYRALLLAGVSRYRNTDYTGALVTFQRLSALAAYPEERAAAFLWIGKTQAALNQPDEARDAWETAAQSDPTDYYSLRAQELLNGTTPFSIDELYDLTFNHQEEKKLAQAWMQITFSIPGETNLDTLGALAQDRRVLRGDLFWELGMYSQAYQEYESLRQEYINDPVNTFRMLDHLVELGFYRLATLESRQILDLANLDDASTLSAPSYFNHIRFGVYHQNLIIPIAEEKGFHPLYIASMMRQESMFEGFATSSAGARGLMQIMPATAQEIVAYSGWPENYTDSDLYRPYINVPIGVRYLERQRDYFNGDLFVSLAAYNAGPGFAIEWNTLAGGDPDLFLEIIRYDETRQYLMQISEFYHIYWDLYGTNP